MRSFIILLALIAAAPAGAQQTAANTTRVYELSEVEVLPRPQNVQDFTSALRDGYPVHLREAGVGGTVQVAFVLNPEGQPGDVRVLSTPDSGFNAPTVQAVSLLRFTPAQVQGRAVAVRVEQPITWRVEPAPAAAPATPAAAMSDSANGYELSAVEVLPRVLNGTAFARELARSYPPHLRDSGIQGTVQVRFRVEPDGTTSNQTITLSTNPEFNAPTLRAVRMLRFRPARVKGRPARVWVEQPIQWSVSGEPGSGAPRLAPPSYEPDRGRFGPPRHPCSVSIC